MENFTEPLIHDLIELLQNSDEYNVIVEAGEGAEFRDFKAHSNILRARSPYFRRALSNHWAKKKNNMLVFKKPNITAKIFEIILRYMYTGVVNLNTEKGADVLQILIAADELELLELIKHGQEHLIKNESKWLQENAVKTMGIVFRHEPFGKLKENYFQMVGSNPDIIFNSNDFLSLEESVLVSLLQMEDLVMEEIEVWQSLIKWGIGNTSRLVEKKLVSWSAEDFAGLEKTIHKCIPLIRYYDISGDDYLNHIIPYKRVIPKSMRKEILTYHLMSIPQLPRDSLPPRARFTGSQILKSRHVNIISSWIDKKIDTTHYKSPYTFKLLYRGSRDGFTVSSFRYLCANQVKTVVVAKIAESGDIVGGYNPTYWVIKDFETKKYADTPDAFIFNLGNRDNFYVARVARNPSERQIAYRKTNGPYFYNDLYFGDKCDERKTCWYEAKNFQPKIFDSNYRFNFKVSELEVFLVKLSLI
ncbi:hypothetical protein G9A89_017569 [Geosiphon pyriformis]|nr:hypothetical protein G9A89_017569 [Geosiphon pyriformis]